MKTIDKITNSSEVVCSREATTKDSKFSITVENKNIILWKLKKEKALFHIKFPTLQK